MQDQYADSYVKWWLEQNRLRSTSVMLDFHGLRLRVLPEVFCPDPALTASTEIFVNTLKALPLKDKTVLDIGTGCGALALLSAKLGAWEVWCTDTSKIALDNARENACANQLEDRIHFINTSLFENIDRKFDYIFANLPITDAAWPDLDQTTDDIYKRLLARAPHHLNQGGALFVAYASFGSQQGHHHIKSSPHQEEVVRLTKFGVQWYLYRFSS